MAKKKLDKGMINDVSGGGILEFEKNKFVIVDDGEPQNLLLILNDGFYSSYEEAQKAAAEFGVISKKIDPEPFSLICKMLSDQFSS